jgi:hypothetical protein
VNDVPAHRWCILKPRGFGDQRAEIEDADDSATSLIVSVAVRGRLTSTREAWCDDERGRDANRIVEEIASRVATGLQLDDVPGRVGEALDGPGVFRGQRRIYTRGTPSPQLRSHGACSNRFRAPLLRLLSAVQRAESLLGAPLPDFLRRLYVEVSNGGSDPATASSA